MEAKYLELGRLRAREAKYLERHMKQHTWNETHDFKIKSLGTSCHTPGISLE
jgi:hypothetical protein